MPDHSKKGNDHTEGLLTPVAEDEPLLTQPCSYSSALSDSALLFSEIFLLLVGGRCALRGRSALCARYARLARCSSLFLVSIVLGSFCSSCLFLLLEGINVIRVE